MKNMPEEGPVSWVVAWERAVGRAVCSEMEGAKISESLDWHLQKQAMDPMGALCHQCFVS